MLLNYNHLTNINIKVKQNWMSYCGCRIFIPYSVSVLLHTYLLPFVPLWISLSPHLIPDNQYSHEQYRHTGYGGQGSSNIF